MSSLLFRNCMRQSVPSSLDPASSPSSARFKDLAERISSFGTQLTLWTPIRTVNEMSWHDLRMAEGVYQHSAESKAQISVFLHLYTPHYNCSSASSHPEGFHSSFSEPINCEKCKFLHIMKIKRYLDHITYMILCILYILYILIAFILSVRRKYLEH